MDLSNITNLLIIGAGQYGAYVKELALSTGNYDRVAFLDDNAPCAIGKVCECKKFLNDYPYAIVAIGNNDIRTKITKEIRDVGFIVPPIISPKAEVSKSSTILEGCIVEPFAVIQANARVCSATLVCSGAVVKHNATVNEGCYLDCNSVVDANAVVPGKYKVKACEVFLRK